MREILASLPAVGSFRVHLHRESEQVADFFGSNELARLGRVDHLGVATAVFPAINHTRLEYVLLQCAITQLISKLYKDNKDLALANVVEVDGLSRTVSSGEELIKAWALLSNVGHPNWTFGTERALLMAALDRNDFRFWLTSGAVEEDLERWAREVIDEFQDDAARFLVTLLRLREERPHDSRKHLFRQLIRNLVLPSELLSFSSPDAREKMNRLRVLASRIRLLAMVALDSYHSHSPLRLQLLPAIQELAESAYRTSGFEKFLTVLEATAGWLADEVYQHPRAVASLRDYEIRGSQKALRRFDRLPDSTHHRRQFLQNIIADGFGHPQSDTLQPLVRLSFERFYARLLGGGHRHERVERLKSKIAIPPATYVSVEENPFVSALHLDVFFRPTGANAEKVGRTYTRLVRWLLTAIEAQALETVRRVIPPESRESDRIELARVRNLRIRLERSEYHLLELFLGIIGHLIPKGWSVATEDYSGRAFARPIAWRVTDSKGVQYDTIGQRLDKLKRGLTETGDSVRLHEIQTGEAIVTRRWQPLVIMALQPLVIRDHFGRKKDEWDGAILEVADDLLRLSVVEGKSTGSLERRTEDAFEQLAQTRTYLKARYSLVTRRRRIKGKGAYLRVDVLRSEAN